MIRFRCVRCKSRAKYVKSGGVHRIWYNMILVRIRKRTDFWEKDRIW